MKHQHVVITQILAGRAGDDAFLVLVTLHREEHKVTHQTMGKMTAQTTSTDHSKNLIVIVTLDLLQQKLCLL